MGVDKKHFGDECSRQGAGATAHSIIVCTRCRHTGTHCLSGHELMSQLRFAIDVAFRTGALEADFTIDGIGCMAGCDRPCTVAYRADGKSSYLFGDVGVGADIGLLVAFATQYATSDDGWTKSTERPVGLNGKTLAHIPSALVIERQTPSRAG